MSGMNRVYLLGNLGADPELRYAASGTPVLNMRMATNEVFIDKNMQRVERTEWHTVVMFGNRAEALQRLLAKGSSICVEGAIRTTTYEKDGQRRYRTEIHARDLHLTGGQSAPTHAPREEADFESEPMPAPPEEMPVVDERPPALRTPRAPRGKNGGPSRKSDVMAEEMPF